MPNRRVAEVFEKGKLTKTRARVVVEFAAELREHPEGVAIDARGRVFVSLAPKGEIHIVEPDGSHHLFASIPAGSAWHAILGLAFDRSGVLYAAAPSDGGRGVWRFSLEGEGLVIPGSEDMVWPNAITFDRQGAMYVTDSVQGSIWRALPGEDAMLWLQAKELEGLSLLGPQPIGANGIVSVADALYVANTEKKQVVAVALASDGSPGEVEALRIFAGDMDFLDGITADVFGNLYVMVAGVNSVVRMGSDGSTETMTDGDMGLSIPASACFGTRGRSTSELYVTSLSPPDLVAEPAPSLIALKT